LITNKVTILWSRTRKMLVMIKRIGQVGLVVVAVEPASQRVQTIVVDNLDRFEGDVVADHLLGDPSADAFAAPELASGVVDHDVLGERLHDGIDIEAVDGSDVGHDCRIKDQLGGGGQVRILP
jgi:hypothetical protein